jgi:hypothetical protein
MDQTINFATTVEGWECSKCAWCNGKKGIVYVHVCAACVHACVRAPIHVALVLKVLCTCTSAQQELAARQQREQEDAQLACRLAEQDARNEQRQAETTAAAHAAAHLQCVGRSRTGTGCKAHALVTSSTVCGTVPT